MYIQTLVYDSDVLDAIAKCIKNNEAEGYRAVWVQADVQRNLFRHENDVFVTLEVEKL